MNNDVSIQRSPSDFTLRPMVQEDWPEVAALIYTSTNAWYEIHGRSAIFNCSIEEVELFCKVYEDLDPGCCILAEDVREGRIAASCFYHPRPTHMSLGIMNVHPNYFGERLAARLLSFITDLADSEKKPTRLVSSAVNLDSFSLYNRHGFVPTLVYQDMMLEVPEEGLDFDPPGVDRVRDGTMDDLPAMTDLELSVSGLQREKDFQYFLKNKDGHWHVSVYEGPRGMLEGFLVSIGHPASRLLGPGCMEGEDVATALIHAELNQHRGFAPVFLVPAFSHLLVQEMYRWGARNCELHFAQVKGAAILPKGIVMPTFMPETG